MQDSKNDFNFELKATEPIKGVLPDLLNNKEVSVNRTQFVKLFREYRKDPVKSLRMLLNSNSSAGGYVKFQQNGREISSDEMLRRIEKKKKLNFKSKKYLYRTRLVRKLIKKPKVLDAFGFLYCFVIIFQYRICPLLSGKPLYC
ncbi:hypothetical protein [Riemerella columbina]|uniref:hypothetical protein n=1 Tax=Riemerella columbina TaxID=103810 RepID=UPI00047681B8|nr:hypothetical protein [Riemerella columbina]